MTDHLLVHRMLAGDEAAFEHFFEANFQRLFRFAVRRIGDADAAEDVVQTTLVTALRKLQTWRGEAALFTWLCTICRHEIAAALARTHRMPQIAWPDDDPLVRGQLEALAADIDTPERALERAQVARRVQITLDYLPGRYGDVLEWKYVLGLSVTEIAERLQSTPKAAESMLARAREAFREGFAVLGRNEATHDI